MYKLDLTTVENVELHLRRLMLMRACRNPEYKDLLFAIPVLARSLCDETLHSKPLARRWRMLWESLRESKTGPGSVRVKLNAEIVSLPLRLCRQELIDFFDGYVEWRGRNGFCTKRSSLGTMRTFFRNHYAVDSNSTFHCSDDCFARFHKLYIEHSTHGCLDSRVCTKRHYIVAGDSVVRGLGRPGARERLFSCDRLSYKGIEVPSSLIESVRGLVLDRERKIGSHLSDSCVYLLWSAEVNNSLSLPILSRNKKSCSVSSANRQDLFSRYDITFKSIVVPKHLIDEARSLALDMEASKGRECTARDIRTILTFVSLKMFDSGTKYIHISRDRNSNSNVSRYTCYTLNKSNARELLLSGNANFKYKGIVVPEKVVNAVRKKVRSAEAKLGHKVSCGTVYRYWSTAARRNLYGKRKLVEKGTHVEASKITRSLLFSNDKFSHWKAEVPAEIVELARSLVLKRESVTGIRMADCSCANLVLILMRKSYRSEAMPTAEKLPSLKTLLLKNARANVFSATAFTYHGFVMGADTLNAIRSAILEHERASGAKCVCEKVMEICIAESRNKLAEEGVLTGCLAADYVKECSMDAERKKVDIRTIRKIRSFLVKTLFGKLQATTVLTPKEYRELVEFEKSNGVVRSDKDLMSIAKIDDPVKFQRLMEGRCNKK